MRDIAIDSSALFNFLDGTASNHLLLSFIKDDARLVIGDTVLRELFNTRTEKLNGRLCTLGRISRHLGIRFVLGRDWWTIVKLEQSKSIRSTPVLSSKVRNRIRVVIEDETIQNKAATFNRFSELQTTKKELSNTDKKILKEVEERRSEFPAEALLQEMRNYNGPSLSNYWFDFFTREYSAYNSSAVLKSPERHRAAWIIAALSEYYNLGAGLPGEFRRTVNDPLIRYTKQEWGAYHDHFIAAEASYCDYIIIEDKAFYKKMSEFYQRKLIWTKPLKIADLLREMQPIR